MQVQIWASNKIQKEERRIMGKWEVGSLLTSYPEVCVCSIQPNRPLALGIVFGVMESVKEWNEKAV